MSKTYVFYGNPRCQNSFYDGYVVGWDLGSKESSAWIVCQNIDPIPFNDEITRVHIEMERRFREDMMRLFGSFPVGDPPTYLTAQNYEPRCNSELDNVYRRHGGTKRPPSTLHPLVQLDEELRKQLETP